MLPVLEIPVRFVSLPLYNVNDNVSLPLYNVNDNKIVNASTIAKKNHSRIRILNSRFALKHNQDREPSPYMNESGTIVAFLEGLAGPTVNPQLLPSGESKCKRADLSDFLKSDGRFKVCQRILTRPLVIKMTHLKDWAKDEDVKYAVDKYEGQGWSYSDAESKKAEALAEMEKLLIDLDSMLVSDEYASRKDSYTWDDVVLVPELRTLSCAPGLKWPKRVRTYLTTALKRGGVSSYFSD